MVMIVSDCEFIRVPFGREAAGRSRLGVVGTYPGSFRKSGKQRGCGIRNLEEDTEDGRSGKEEKTDHTGLTRLAEMRSIIHDPWYHRLYHVSNTNLVLVCSELTSFVRKILQREENKGVELTVDLCSGLRAMGSGRMGEDAGPETIE